MAAVKQQVLNWLYSVLTSEYKDVNRTYNDVAQALSHYSSLAPRTDVYTYENGANALLLHISGILPVNYRGTTYRFPIALWVPHSYPREAPLAYVTPAEGMVVRPGQHVDLQGKLYHPYLANWAEYWDKSNILDFLAILRDIFAKEPPVVARQQAPPPRPTSQIQSAPPIPPLPPGVGRPATVISASPRSSDQVQPPPPPPKPSQSQGSISGPSRYESGPPLPPLPPPAGQESSRYGSSISHQQQTPHQHAPQRSSSLRYETAPPLPPQPSKQGSIRNASYEPVSPLTPPQDQYRRPPHDQQYQQSQYISGPPQPQAQTRQPLPPTYNNQQQQPYHQSPQTQWQNQSQSQPHHPQQFQSHPPPQQYQQQPPPPQQPKPALPQIDLLSEPLTLPTPTSSTLTPPPIPPNPEKDLLLHNLAKALSSQRAHTASQTTTSLPGLAAQHRAMLTSLNSMNAELQALESLSSLLSSNTSILQSSLHEADAVISSSQHRKTPNVDELLVAPTVVGNQLYETVCEERALGDALFVLGRAVEKGTISPGTFAKMTRSLAREWFLKKALVRKIGKGMGLSDGH